LLTFCPGWPLTMILPSLLPMYLGSSMPGLGMSFSFLIFWYSLYVHTDAFNAVTHFCEDMFIFLSVLWFTKSLSVYLHVTSSFFCQYRYTVEPL
jgi:hypothetical protein